MYKILNNIEEENNVQFTYSEIELIESPKNIKFKSISIEKKYLDQKKVFQNILKRTKYNDNILIVSSLYYASQKHESGQDIDHIIIYDNSFGHLETQYFKDVIHFDHMVKRTLHSLFGPTPYRFDKDIQMPKGQLKLAIYIDNKNLNNEEYLTNLKNYLYGIYRSVNHSPEIFYKSKNRIRYKSLRDFI